MRLSAYLICIKECGLGKLRAATAEACIAASRTGLLLADPVSLTQVKVSQSPGINSLVQDPLSAAGLCDIILSEQNCDEDASTQRDG